MGEGEGWGASGSTHTEDEEKLDEHGAKGQDPSHENAAENGRVNTAGRPGPLEASGSLLSQQE